MKHSRFLKNQGFTLVELLVAMAVFAILMVAVSQIFASAFGGYRATRTVQKNTEAAQFAMNNIAKALRTSSVVSPSGDQNYVRFIDYSQNRCFEYRLGAGNTLAVASDTVTYDSDSDDMKDECAGKNFSGSFSSVTSGITSVRFYVVTSSGDPDVPVGSESKRVGRVTIAFQVQEGPDHLARIQTSTSLRDYGAIGMY